MLRWHFVPFVATVRTDYNSRHSGSARFLPLPPRGGWHTPTPVCDGNPRIDTPKAAQKSQERHRPDPRRKESQNAENPTD